MKISNPDLLIKPSAQSSAFQTAMGLDGVNKIKREAGTTVQFDAQGGRAYSLYCIEEHHKMCRYENCDCKCHDEAKHKRLAEAWLVGDKLPIVGQVEVVNPGTGPVQVNVIPRKPLEPYTSLACRNNRCGFCKSESCSCQCHNPLYDAPEWGNPAFKHEMDR